MTAASRARVVEVGPLGCHRKMKPGQVKRITARGPLIGYYLACPACGYRASYLDEACRFEEHPALLGAPHPRSLTGIGSPPPCLGCKRTLRIVEGYMEAS